ncbi:MAG: hypothetical protein ACHQ01_07795 [Candidatus Limnocylindrales bacterium]
MNGVRVCVICGAPAPAGLGPDAVVFCGACRGRATEDLERLVRLEKELEEARERVALRMAASPAELPKRRPRDPESRALYDAVVRIRANGGRP